MQADHHFCPSPPLAKIVEALVCHQKRKSYSIDGSPNCPNQPSPCCRRPHPTAPPVPGAQPLVTIGPGSPIVASAKAPGRAGGWSSSWTPGEDRVVGAFSPAELCRALFLFYRCCCSELPTFSAFEQTARQVASHHRTPFKKDSQHTTSPLEITERYRPACSLPSHASVAQRSPFPNSAAA